MRRLAQATLLGWFFMTTYGSVGKHDFNDPIRCEVTRKAIVARLTTVGASKHVDLQCTADPAPQRTVDVTGTVTIDATAMPAKK